MNGWAEYLMDLEIGDDVLKVLVVGCWFPGEYVPGESVLPDEWRTLLVVDQKSGMKIETANWPPEIFDEIASTAAELREDDGADSDPDEY